MADVSLWTVKSNPALVWNTEPSKRVHLILKWKLLLLCYQSLFEFFTAVCATSHPPLLGRQKNWYPSNSSRHSYFVCSPAECVCMYLCIRCWHACACLEAMCVCLRACVHPLGLMYAGASPGCRCWDAQRHSAPACNGSGFIGIWEKKAVYIVSYTVTDGHNNAVRQGLVSRFLCITSIDGVCALHSKCAPHGEQDGIRIKRDGGGMPADPTRHYWRSQNSHAKSTEFENLIYNNWI